MNERQGAKNPKYIESKFRRGQKLALRHIVKEIETELIKSLEEVFESGAVPESWKVRPNDNRTAEMVTDMYCGLGLFKPEGLENELNCRNIKLSIG